MQDRPLYEEVVVNHKVDKLAQLENIDCHFIRIHLVLRGEVIGPVYLLLEIEKNAKVHNAEENLVFHYKNVARLNIAMCNLLFVHLTNEEGYLGRNLHYHIFRQLTRLF